MSCNRPLTAWQPIEGGTLAFEKPKGMAATQIKIPCRQCMGCRVIYGYTWAGRMCLEGAEHEHNHFATMTYDEKNLPADRNLNYEHIQKFHRRMRKQFGPFRFVTVGEYGEATSRPHYHSCYFGLYLPDVEIVGRGSRGDPLYTSPALEECWGMGLVRIGEFNMTTANYIAAYACKDARAKHPGAYDYVNDKGQVVARDLPKLRMSRRPGIAAGWFERYGMTDLFPKGFVHTGDGRTLWAREYFMAKLKEIEPEMYEEIKATRRNALEKMECLKESTPERRATKENLLKLREVNAKRERRNKL